MIDERELISRAVDEQAPPEPSFERLVSRRDRKRRNQRIRAGVLGVRRSGSSRRAELSLADGLPSVEIELPEGHAVRRGDVLPVVLTHLRLFTR